MRKPEPYLPRGHSGQPSPSDESCPQASPSCPPTSCSPTNCGWLTCCCTPTIRSNGTDGDQGSRCGCGLCCWAHTVPCHHWRLRWGSGTEPSRPDITYQEPPGAQPVYQQQQQFGPCHYEMKQFWECAQNQGNLKLCEGFSEVLKQCKFANGLA